MDGVGKQAPVGFRDIRLSFELDTDEPRERNDTLRKPPALAIR